MLGCLRLEGAGAGIVLSKLLRRDGVVRVLALPVRL